MPRKTPQKVSQPPVKRSKAISGSSTPKEIIEALNVKILLLIKTLWFNGDMDYDVVEKVASMGINKTTRIDGFEVYVEGEIKGKIVGYKSKTWDDPEEFEVIEETFYGKVLIYDNETEVEQNNLIIELT